MPRISEPEKRAKDQILFYIKNGTEKLSHYGALQIAKSPELNQFLLFLAKEAPKECQKVCERASKAAVERAEEKGLQKDKTYEETPKKRTTPYEKILLRKTKKAKTDYSDGNVGKRSFRYAPSFNLRSKRATRDPSLKSGGHCEKDNDTDSDDGVELAPSGEAGGPEEEQGEKQQDVVENEDEESHEEQQHEDEGEKDDESDEEHGKQTEVAEKNGQNQQMEIDEAEEQPKEQDVQNSSPDQPTQENGSQDHPHQERRFVMLPSQQPQSNIDQEFVEYHLELGLTRGDDKVVTWVRNRSRGLASPSADIAFDICTKLDFDLVKSALLDFHKNRRAEMSTRRGIGGIPSIHDLSDPDKIYDALRGIQGDAKVLKIHRAFGQMKLFHRINSESSLGGESHIKILDKRAESKAGLVSGSEKRVRIQNYKNEYYGGCKWQAVASWFGGTGVVMIFIVAGIGSQVIAKELRDDQRQALKEIASHLKGVKKIIQVLGSDSLEEYCRCGYLSEEKIGELEGLEPNFPEAEDELRVAEVDGSEKGSGSGSDTEG